ncbi:hypothetical protein TOPH_09247 [Tolypocladium ophioglossoides CBS 100239]|uniref:BTB domain-containing protein n=1 Tax=Tolypocladium ophioglossoides (strain CBS 100239) TaxID=1163406 RepID=A0A0L0MWG7_TOLOC|nr:hypothetical protein TOPH_09247 [Tolypocladium ophioglossoides CBS 100239]
MLASARARVMFRGGYRESEVAPADGFRHWKFEPVFCPKAFEIVLNIIHGQTQKVPDQVTLGMMAEISAVVDDLQCHDAVCFLAKIWIGKLRTYLPDEICADVSRWIFIASVFNKPELFRQATRTALWHSTEPIASAGLPICARIIGTRKIFHSGTWLNERLDMIDSERQTLLGCLMTQLEKEITRLSRDESSCTFECTSALLGGIIKGLSTKSFLYPLPPPPFVELSFNSAIKKVRELQTPEVYGPREHDEYDSSGLFWVLRRQDSGYPYDIYGDFYVKKKKKTPSKNAWDIKEKHHSADNCPTKLFAHTCSLRELLEPGLQELESKIVGLDLSDFLKH